jgi:hypothetical protein
VYEYTNQDGVTFWSFEKLPTVVTHSHTMKMGDRVGTHFDNYLAELRALRRYLIDEETDEEPGGG